MEPLLVVLIPAILALFGTLITVIYANRTKQSENRTKLLEIGMTTFVERLEHSLEDCEGKCKQLQLKYDDLTTLYDELEARHGGLKSLLEDKDAEIIRLKWKSGELP